VSSDSDEVEVAITIRYALKYSDCDIIELAVRDSVAVAIIDAGKVAVSERESAGGAPVGEVAGRIPDMTGRATLERRDWFAGRRDEFLVVGEATGKLSRQCMKPQWI
jgi:hypothetical protein